MLALARGAYNAINQKNEYFLLLVGLDSCGKTTFVERVRENHDGKARKNRRIVSTVGLNLVQVVSGNALLTFWDLGGEKTLRYLWKTYSEKCDALIFVFDSTDVNRNGESIDEFENLLPRVEFSPVLVLISKCDTHTDGDDSTVPNLSRRTTNPSFSNSNKNEGSKNDMHSQNELSRVALKKQISEKLCCLHKGENAIIDISSLENINVQKSIQWIISVIK